MRATLSYSSGFLSSIPILSQVGGELTWIHLSDLCLTSPLNIAGGFVDTNAGTHCGIRFFCQSHTPECVFLFKRHPAPFMLV